MSLIEPSVPTALYSVQEIQNVLRMANGSSAPMESASASSVGDEILDVRRRAAKVRKVVLAGHELKAFPEELAYFTNATEIDVRSNNVRFVNGDVLAGLHHIHKLNLSKNGMLRLEGSFYLPVCEEVDLSSNVLTSLPFAFTSDRLKFERYFAAPNLVRLDLSHNQLAELPAGIGTHCRHLRILNLAYNFLKTLPPEIGKCTRLYTLYAHNNKLTSLPSSLGQIHDLEDLDVSDNELVELPASVSDLTCLNRLIVQRNKLTLLPNLSNCKQLVKIEAQNNQISRVDNARLDEAVSLQFLRLNDNVLSEFPGGVFQKAPHLHTVDLSNNQLVRLADTIESAHELTFLDVSDNMLSSLPAGIKVLMKQYKLQSFFVSRNNLPLKDDRISTHRTSTRIGNTSNVVDSVPNADEDFRSPNDVAAMVIPSADDPGRADDLEDE